MVIGGSQGIGRAFALACAARGLDVIITGRRPAPLEDVRKEIEAGSGVSCSVIVCDMTEEGAAEQLEERTKGLEIGLVIYNAADTWVGPFLEEPFEHCGRIINVNCRGVLEIMHRFGKRFTEKGRGGFILMSSMSGLQGTPLVAAYAATKAFIRVLGESLWEEFLPFGVDVLTCIAGAIRTPNYLATKPEESGALVPEMAPETVAEKALAGLGRKPSLIPGVLNNLAGFLMGRLLSRKAAVRFIAGNMHRQYRM